MNFIRGINHTITNLISTGTPERVDGEDSPSVPAAAASASDATSSKAKAAAPTEKPAPVPPKPAGPPKAAAKAAHKQAMKENNAAAVLSSASVPASASEGTATASEASSSKEPVTPAAKPAVDKGSTGTKEKSRKSLIVPAWLHAEGQRIHSATQNSGGDPDKLSKSKKKYRQSFCLWCAKFHPTSPWGSLKLRKYEQEAFCKHEKSFVHQKAVGDLNKAIANGEIADYSADLVDSLAAAGVTKASSTLPPVGGVVGDDEDAEAAAKDPKAVGKRKRGAATAVEAVSGSGADDEPAAKAAKDTTTTATTSTTTTGAAEATTTPTTAATTATTLSNRSATTTVSNPDGSERTVLKRGSKKRTKMAKKAAEEEGEAGADVTADDAAPKGKKRTKADRLPIPVWVDAIGEMQHSAHQLAEKEKPESTLDLAKAKKKYRQSQCSFCALFHPASPWGTMKLRKFETETFVKHEKSLVHQLSAEMSKTGEATEAGVSVGASAGAPQHVLIGATGGQSKVASAAAVNKSIAQTKVIQNKAIQDKLNEMEATLGSSSSPAPIEEHVV
jgi:hypothetical protein